MFNPTVKFTILEDCGVEKRVEQRENEAICEAYEGSPRSHSDVEGSVVPLSSRELMSKIASVRFCRSSKKRVSFQQGVV